MRSHRQHFLLVLLVCTAGAMDTLVGCDGGACPSPFLSEDGSSTSTATRSTSSDNKCGFWLGPSHIKRAENHGFGLGIFTGLSIGKGTAIEPLYNGGKGTVGEPLLPFFGAEALYEEHPPLREYGKYRTMYAYLYNVQCTTMCILILLLMLSYYLIIILLLLRACTYSYSILSLQYILILTVWGEENAPEVAVVYPSGLTALFAPGLAAIAPCTAVNFNLQILGPGKANGMRQSVHEHEHEHEHDGSSASRTNFTYVAVRDISPGEELTVECDDDDYDGGAYFLSQYQPNDDSLVCLDQNLIVQTSTLQGHGLFAKRLLSANTTILASPVLPIHRNELEMDNIQGIPTSAQQLILNYCYGHASSDLLWLPYGPLINYLNHSPQPNAKLRWHDKLDTHNENNTHARQQHHHPELFALSANVVAKIHGKSLTLDVVATRPILPGEEVTIDYGQAWTEAWDEYGKIKQAKSAIAHPRVSAEHYNLQHSAEGYRTQLEQLVHPYPDNLELFCFYSLQQEFDDKNIHRHVVTFDPDMDHDCFRPCQILERLQDIQQDYYYTVQLSERDDDRIVSHCILDNHDEIWTRVPQRAIRLVDRPYTTPVFSPDAPRQEIGLPFDMIPAAWLRKKLRTSVRNSAATMGHEFKRKKTVDVGVKGSMATSSSKAATTTVTASRMQWQTLVVNAE
jgi:SET domain